MSELSGLTVCVLASGSSGNCTFIGTPKTKILIDLGLPGKTILRRLGAIGVAPDELDGILVTHEHSDHISGIPIFAYSYDIPVFANEPAWEVLEAILEARRGRGDKGNQEAFKEGEAFEIGDLVIFPFSIPHDAVAPVGYRILWGGVSIALATDLGHMPAKVKKHLRDVDLLIIESNHDPAMLMAGSYPWMLKQRIMSDVGHLSNQDAGRCLSEVITGRTRQVFLAHLSKENNLPELALLTVRTLLKEKGIGGEVRLSLTYRDRMARPCFLGR